MKNMKKTSKMFAITLAGLLATGSMVGCGGATGDLDEFKNRPNEVVVYYASNAYGKDWITKIAQKYMTDHNQDTYINLKKTVTQTEELAKVESGVAVGDLYLLDCHLEEKVFAYESIADVYDSYPIGETDKKISEKLTESYKTYFDNAGARDYIMPYASVSGGYNFAYNKTLLDSLFPDGYELPRTTDEFIELGEMIKNDAYLLLASFKDASDYSTYMLKSWFTQLMGFENYEQFMAGRYWDETAQSYLFDETAPTVYEKNKVALEDYFDLVKSIFSIENGYLHDDWVAMDAMDVEAALAGFGFGQNAKPGVFLVNGSYLEQEMGWMLAEQEAAGNKQEIRMMQMPVASDIVKRTPSIDTDAELRTVVDYVDKVLAGESATKPSGVEDADIEVIKEARGVCGAYMAGGMIVPKAAKNKAGAKDFIRYLASDEAAIIAAQNTNGINLLPFSKQVTDEELGFTRTDFIADCMKISNAITHVVSSDSQEHKFAYVTKFGISGAAAFNGYILKFCNGTNTLNGKTFYQDNYQAFAGKWETMITEFKSQGGNTAN